MDGVGGCGVGGEVMMKGRLFGKGVERGGVEGRLGWGR